MKNTIKNFLMISFLLMVSFLHAQENEPKKVIESTFKVSGVCTMCQNRIERAALSIKGVDAAEWNKKSGMLQVNYYSNHTDEQSIMKVIAKAGHDTEKVKATDEAYNKLPGCCKYRDGLDVH